ncbi:MAG: biotin/lipoyl-containing protein [Candidatus Electryonea clarkiae]|nr:biotin/lipoyl-containing protein [Candidatus Electryonea clarkiae]MDP8289289.1 biotin/lipoyl-containing protein [Candidatus Electryonea clarkiae]
MNNKNYSSDFHGESGYKVEINGNTYEVSFDNGKNIVQINGDPVNLDICLEQEPDLYSVIVDGKSVLIAIEDNGAPGNYHVHTSGYDFETEVITAREAQLREFIHGADSGKKESIIKAPMPGLIVKYILNEGDEVQPGQGVIIMEAMKMENEIKAPTAGSISHFHVKEGDAVEKGQPLFEINN